MSISVSKFSPVAEYYNGNSLALRFVVLHEATGNRTNWTKLDFADFWKFCRSTSEPYIQHIHSYLTWFIKIIYDYFENQFERLLPIKINLLKKIIFAVLDFFCSKCMHDNQYLKTFTYIKLRGQTGILWIATKLRKNQTCPGICKFATFLWSSLLFWIPRTNS